MSEMKNRLARILTMHEAGYGVDWIAAQVGMSEQDVRRAVVEWADDGGASLASDATLAASEAAEAIRALVHATIGPERYSEPAEVDRVVSELQALAERLPQALAQVLAWLRHQDQRGALAHDEPPGGEVTLVLALETARYNLMRAGDDAESLARHLARAHEETSHLKRLDAREARCMEPGTLDPERLQPGDRFLRNYRDQLITVEILRAREPWTDQFGREMFRYWARRSDTGAEGWMPFGPGAAPLWVAPELAP